MTTPDRFDLLMQHCADMGIDVEYDDLGSKHGVYRVSDRGEAIVLNGRCTMAQMIGALSHEVGHAIHLDRCQSDAHERRADRTGASLIITPAEYAEAEREVGDHAGALALRLGVTRRVVLGWRDWYRCLPFEREAAG